MRNLTDINWPEIYVFMESKTSLVLESKLDYRIAPKGRAQFHLKHLVNASSSGEWFMEQFFPNDVCLAVMLWICINRIIAKY